MKSTEGYLTVREAAGVLNCSEEHIRRLYRRGELLGARKLSTSVNARIRIARKGLERHIKALPVGGF